MLKSILIIEDDPGIRSSLQEFFESEGYPVLLSENGQEALDLLALGTKALPGLILLDIGMPVLDGPSFLVKLKENHPKIYADVPIFITTAGGDSRRLTIKTTGFLKKPFNLDELSQTAERYCHLGVD